MPQLVKMTLNSDLPIDIEQRVNIVYCKIVIVLMEKEVTLYPNILASMDSFLVLKADKINCKHQIFRVFELLIGFIKNNKQVERTNSVIPLILNRVKENFSNELSK